MGEADERVVSMSHDSGFRRNDHDSMHRPTLQRQGTTKASRHLEEQMKRRHEHHERLRRILEAKKTEV